jgi:N-acetylglutamate synthase
VSLVRGLQERAARAVPAVVVERVDGWWLRYADTSAWWTSSVLPHGDVTPAELPERIRAAEEFYTGRGAVTRFQISPGAASAGLDEALAARGYRVVSPESLRAASTQDVIDRLSTADATDRLSTRDATDRPSTRDAADRPSTRDAADRPSMGDIAGWSTAPAPSNVVPRIVVDDRPTDEWLGAWLTVRGGDLVRERDLLGRVRQPSGYAAVRGPTGVVAVGRAVADTGWAGVFGMATLPAARGQGAAGLVLAALARWAADHDIADLYLQVEPDNVPAGRLYTRAGFTEVCPYHYRSRSVGHQDPVELGR